MNAPRDWNSLCEALRREEFISDQRFSTQEQRIENMPLLIKEISEAFLEEDMDFWLQRLTKYDIPHSKVFTYEEAAADPQKIENGVIVPFNHPEYGPMKTISSPFDVSGSDKREPSAAPKLGEHTEEILREAGYKGDELEKFLST